MLTFDADTHTYRLDGRVLPSVTQVLERTGLVDYSFLPPATRDMALARGRAVHEAIALDLEGDLDESSLEGQDGSIAGYIEAARSARRDLGIIGQPELFEHRAHHPAYLYAGTCDLIHGDLLIDWKTNKAEWWVRLQTAAYAALHPEPGRFRRIAVELHNDGTYRLLTFAASNYRRDFADFAAALRVLQLLDEHDRTRKAA